MKKASISMPFLLKQHLNGIFFGNKVLCMHNFFRFYGNRMKKNVSSASNTLRILKTNLTQINT